MSGANRRLMNTAGSNFLACACASALSSHDNMLPSVLAKIGTLAEYIEMLTVQVSSLMV
jgi:hypothetical protein